MTNLWYFCSEIYNVMFIHPSIDAVGLTRSANFYFSKLLWPKWASMVRNCKFDIAPQVIITSPVNVAAAKNDEKNTDGEMLFLILQKTNMWSKCNRANKVMPFSHVKWLSCRSPQAVRQVPIIFADPSASIYIGACRWFLYIYLFCFFFLHKRGFLYFRGTSV